MKVGSVAGGADAELVALGVGEDDPALAPLLDGSFDAPRSEADQPFGLGLDVGGMDVEVHAVLAGLGLGHALEDQLVLGAVAGPEDDVLAGRRGLLVAEGARPERR